MTQNRVRELAQELAEHLDEDAQLDPEARAALDQLRRHVDDALAGKSARPSAQARGLIERFEQDHPDLTALIQRLADALSNAGL